jgi:hypothetical protein
MMNITFPSSKHKRKCEDEKRQWSLTTLDHGNRVNLFSDTIMNVLTLNEFSPFIVDIK